MKVSMGFYIVSWLNLFALLVWLGFATFDHIWQKQAVKSCGAYYSKTTGEFTWQTCGDVK